MLGELEVGRHKSSSFSRDRLFLPSGKRLTSVPNLRDSSHFYTAFDEMAPRPSEADVIFNRANVALAKSQRLVASWLPPRTEAELQSSKSEEQIEKEEQELFTPVPELYVRITNSLYPV